MRGYLLVCSSLISIVRLMLYYKKCFKTSGGLRFSLLRYFFENKQGASVFKASERLLLINQVNKYN